VLAWHRAHAGAESFLSVLVVGELRQGVQRLRPRDTSQADVLDQWISGLLRGYADRILPVSVDVADQWGRLNASVGAASHRWASRRDGAGAPADLGNSQSRRCGRDRRDNRQSV
jgi:predicted nucleic acid-binding protein